MVDFFGTFAAKQMLKKTIQLAGEQLALAWSFKDELSKLRDSLIILENFLNDAERIKANHEALKLWVEKLEEIVSEADFLLDKLAYEDLRQFGNIVSLYSLTFRSKTASQIKKIHKKLKGHYKLGNVLGLLLCPKIKSYLIESDSYPDEFEFIGKQSEIMEIVERVVHLSVREPLGIISIIGIGGLGKTAIAKAIFHHEAVRKRFYNTIWVHVSEAFVTKDILKAMLETFHSTSGILDRKENILKELKNCLRNNKYFLVLDDVWNENPNLWNELRSCLIKINSKFGSVIVVTTRSHEVANIMGTHYKHNLRNLSDNHCWTLFEKCAYRSPLPIIPNIDSVREEFIQKFGGVPLVVKVLGECVKLEIFFEGLPMFLETIIRSALQDEEHILSTIKLSVDRLPSLAMKQCFVFCSNFPRGFLYEKETLVQMWIGHNLIQIPSTSDLLMEDVGGNYFDIMLSRSLFQDPIKDNQGRLISCRMHNIIHDIARAISKDKQLGLDILMDEELQREKISSMGVGITTLYCSESMTEMLHLSTFGSPIFPKNIIYLVNLRVLTLNSCFIRKLPESIHKLKYLGYLDVSGSRIQEVPKSIVSLQHLQTLKLPSNTTRLPSNLRKLTNLRHLNISLIRNNDIEVPIKEMPKHLGELIQLQTLSTFVVGFDKGRWIEELRTLKNLKGELGLFCLDRVKTREEAVRADLVEKTKVSDLYLHWGLGSEIQNNHDKHLGVLEGLQPPKTLLGLKIYNFPSKSLPNGIFVENLVEICLENCTNCETLPMLGELSKLEMLQIRSFPKVKSIGDEFYGNNCEKILFPKLKEFNIFQMESLERFATTSICKIFPLLKNLTISSCMKLTELPNWLKQCSALKRVTIEKCPNLIP